MVITNNFQAPDGTMTRGYQPRNLDEATSPSHPRLIADYKADKGLKKWAYSPLEMAEFLNLAHEKYTPSKEASQLITSPIPQTQTTKQFKSVLTAWMKIFDSWFFADSISETLGEIVFFDDPQEPRAFFEDEAIDGHSANSLFVNLRSDSREIEDWPDYEGNFEEFYIATLLHEMVHAFCNIYHCQEECCKVRTWHPSTGGIGNDGHGQPFSEGLKSILDILVARGLTWIVEPMADSLGNSVVYSMYKELWQPTKEQLENWNVSVARFGHVDNWYPLRQEAIADGEFDPGAHP